MSLYRSPLLLLSLIAASIFFAEALVMVAIFMFELHPFAELLLDSTLLVLMLSPALYFFLFRPLLLHINERRQAERALEESETLYRMVHTTAFDAIIIADARGRIIQCNPSAEKIFGYGPGEMLGMDLVELMPESYRARHRAGFERFLSTGRSSIHGKVLEFEGLRKNGEVFSIEIVISSFAIDGEMRFTGTIRDITARKKAEEEKEKMQAQLHQAQKMKAIGTLAGGVAHDFNNLLTALRGNAEMALENMDNRELVKKNLKEIVLTVVHAAELTQQLLLLSRRHPARLVPLNMNIKIQELLKLLDRLIGEDIAVSTDLEEDIWTVRADEGSIAHVVMNLVLNARDAMPEGGSLVIRTRNVVLDERGAKLSPEAPPGRYVALVIEDTGVGISKEDLPRIFEPFFTTKESGKGTGLGLSIVYSTVRQHGGWINVRSTPGRGSTFEVYLPAYEEEATEEVESEVPVEELRGSGQRILLVEDERGVREFAAEALRRYGYAVLSASCAEEALDIFKKEGGGFSLLLSDVVLPDRNGLWLANEILSIRPEVPVLLTSGYADKKVKWSDIREKGFQFLQKPFSLVQLLKAVKEAVKERSDTPDKEG